MQSAFLGVEKSLLGRQWVARPYDERQALAIAQRFQLPDVLARGLSARGLTVETAESFLDPRLRDLMPNPSLLKDMDKAVDRFIVALKAKEKIAVFGDYDVDGATSSALLIRYTRALGHDLRLYIPDRQTEGYGPNPKAMQTLAKEGIGLTVTVDCGVTSYDALEAAKEAGMDVIVIDHHAAEPNLPPAVAVVNPNRIDDQMMDELGTLAAVGVTYLFLVAVNRALKEQGIKTPNLLSLLDLVALGTVCDVVKLTGLNRAYVAQGLKVMQARQNVGIAALAQTARASREMDSFTAGFVLGPRVNAGGRIGESSTGARLLSSMDESEVIGLAARLDQLNEERREIESEILIQAEAMSFDQDAPVTFVASEKWHPGVIGIVASRLKDKYHRPAIVVALENGIGKGSGRSVGTVDLGAAVIAARQSGLLINGGGHKMAAGLTVAADKIDDLRAFLNERIGKILEAEPFTPIVTIDGLVSAGALTPAFIKDLDKLAPFGTGNSEPQFAMADCKIVRAYVVGENHVKLIVQQGTGRLDAIAFRAMDNPMGQGLLSLLGQRCHLVGYLRLNVWQGRESVQMIVKDAAPSI